MSKRTGSSARPAADGAGRLAWVALGGLAVLAICGQWVIFQAERQVDRLAGINPGFIASRDDFSEMWHAGHALLTGASAFPWYGDGHLLGYAPPYSALLSPLGAVPFGVAMVLSVVLSAALVAAVLVGWSGGWSRAAPSGLALLLSYPVFNLVRLGQLQTALGLAGLSAAVWAQWRQRWWLVGVALAVGAIRTPNAIPLVGMLAVALSPRPRELVVVCVASLAVLLPLVLVAQAWDGQWVADWLRNLDTDQQVGLQRAVKSAFGLKGVIGLECAGLAAGAALGWASRGKRLDLDRAALALAIGVLLTHLSGLYVAVFILPAVIRLGMRMSLRPAPWVLAALPWGIVLALAAGLLGGRPTTYLDLLTLLVPAMLLCVYPLVRSPRQRVLAA